MPQLHKKTTPTSHYWQHTGDLMVQYDMATYRGAYIPINVKLNGESTQGLTLTNDIEKACINNYLNLHNGK